LIDEEEQLQCKDVTLDRRVVKFQAEDVHVAKKM